MGYLLGQCPQCNNVMSMPDDSAEVQCPTCNNVVLAAEAAALAGTSSQLQQPGAGATQAAGEAQAQVLEPATGMGSGAPQQPAAGDPWAAASTASGGVPGAQQQAPFTPSPASGPQSGMVQPPASFGAPSNAPLLGTWQTNVLFTVLGVVASALLNSLGEIMGEDSTLPGIIALVYVIFAIVYALRIYPSYFTDKPALDSNEAISFLNTFAGGLIFGLLWNHNLTRKEKGVSNIVFVVLIGCTFVLSLFAVVAMTAYLLS